MPVYNTAAFLREAMDSMLNQTFTDFEIIVLNDCSPDNADEILDIYTDSRIVKYRGEKNQGLANVLNVGMDMARGKYIARMDSDDISLPTRLQVQVDYLEAHPDVDLCSAGMHLFGARNETWSRPMGTEDVKITALFYSPILHASSVWRKASFDKHGLRFRQEMVPAEDYELWTRALLLGLNMVNIPDVLYQYRIHASQATENVNKTGAKEILLKEAYFQAAFPLSSSELRERYGHLKEYALSDLQGLKCLVDDMIMENGKASFFDNKVFSYKMHRYYQGCVFAYLCKKTNRVTLDLIKDLRFKQILKLALKRK